jgi:methanethiol S-methyltransferase
VFAWAGAGLFLASLAYFLYSFLVTYAVPVVGTAAGVVAWNIALFSIFALHHSVFARERVRARVMAVLPEGLERSFYVWVASLLFIAVCALWKPVGGVLWDAGGALVAVLWMLQLFGGYLTLRSAAIINVRELAGIPTRPTGPTPPTSSNRPTEFGTIGP